jgi:hypothetical protein
MYGKSGLQEEETELINFLKSEARKRWEHVDHNTWPTPESYEGYLAQEWAEILYKITEDSIEDQDDGYDISSSLQSDVPIDTSEPEGWGGGREVRDGEW